MRKTRESTLSIVLVTFVDFGVMVNDASEEKSKGDNVKGCR
jgi:hypothetical protein